MTGERGREHEGEGLGSILERITDGIVAYDRQWRFTYVNRRMEQYFGRPREELLGKNVWEEFPSAVNSLYYRELHRAAAEQSPIAFTMPALRSRRWYDVTAYPRADGVSVYLRDITEKRLAEEALQKSEARYRMIFDNSVEGILLGGPDGAIHAANAAACSMLGYTEEELCRLGRQGIADMTDGGWKDALAEHERANRNTAVLPFIRKDGSKFLAEVASAIFGDEDGTPRTCSIVTTITNITERKRAEESLRFLSEASRELVRRLDDDGRLQNMARLLVPRLADICVVDLLEGDEVRRVAAAHEESADPSVTVLSQAEVLKVLRTGVPELLPEVHDEYLKSAMLVPLLLEGKPVGVLSFASLHTSRRYEQADLALALSIADWAALAIDHGRLYRKALQASQMRDEVLRVVSHDLRDPLQNIGIAAQLILMSTESARTKQHIARIQRSVSTAHRLIEDLLDIARIEVGKLTLELQRHDVAPIVNEAIELIRALVEQKSLRVFVELSPHLPAISVDYHRLLQVFANLLGNAVKYALDGGWVRVAAALDGDVVRFSIEDNGPGIPKESLPHVFDRFWQAKAEQRAGAGLGLGLAIAKTIVEMHGGVIWVESEEGKGTAVHFSCPLHAYLSATG